MTANDNQTPRGFTRFSWEASLHALEKRTGLALTTGERQFLVSLAVGLEIVSQAPECATRIPEDVLEVARSGWLVLKSLDLPIIDDLCETAKLVGLE